MAQEVRDPDDIATYGQDYLVFCHKIKRLTAIDLGNYKGQQMHRRLESYRLRHGAPSFAALASEVQSDPDKLKDLVDYLTINVSEFFRNPDHWRILKEEVLPSLAGGGSPSAIKAWSAGCSTGQEAYSLAILLSEVGASRSTVLATDIDEPSLRKAEEGAYTLQEVTGVAKHRLARYFALKDGKYLIREDIRKMVSFRRGNLLSDPYPSGMDLVLCRNVLIYFTEEGKRRVIEGLAASLKPGGVLFTGAAEAIFNPGAYGLTQIRPFFYRRVRNGGV